MAYKFQSLAATMSGSLTQEGTFTVKNDAGTTAFTATDAGVVSGSGNFSAGGTVSLLGVADTAIAVGSDSLYFKDADGLVKSDTVADLMTAAAGAGLAASSGVLAVDIDELSALGGAGLHQTQDYFMFSDNGTEKKITFSNLQDAVFADVSGDATVAAGGALTIGSDAIETAMLNDNIISGQTELAHADIADADEFMISDGGALKRVGVDSLRDHYFGVVSGDATIADGGALTIAANAVQTGMVHDDVATELAGAGLAAASGVMSVQASGSLHIDSDKVSITGSFAGDCLDQGPNESADAMLTIHVVADESTINSVGRTTLRVANAGITATQLATSVAGAGLAGGGGTALSIDIDELSALGGTGVAQGDHFLFSDGGTEKKITASNLEDWIFGNVSGDATVAAGGALTLANNSVSQAQLDDDAVGADELAANAVVNASIASNAAIDIDKLDGGSCASSLTDLAQGDLIYAGDVDASNAIKSITFSNLEDAIFGNVSGDATIAAGGTLTIASDAVEPSMMNIFDDSLAATTTHFLIADGTDYSSFALSGDVTCTNAGVVTIANDAIETAMLNDNIISGQTELAHADIADADEFMISDGGTLKKVGVDSLRDHYFGVVSGDATIADGGALTIAANAVQDSMVNDDVATGLAGDGLAAASGVMSLDLNELSAATVAVAADSIAIIDATDNSSKKESIADLVAGMAGAGLSAASGQLSVTGNNVSLKADSNALVEGYNYFADASSNATVTMPASPSVGDVVVAKAGNLTSNAVITINKGSADHRIDGLEGIVLESPFAAVTMVYVVADHWKIV